MKKNVLGLICCLGLIYSAKTDAVNCVIGGSDFETSDALFNPQLSNDKNGWFSKDVDKLLSKECGSSCDYYADVSDAVHVGMASDIISTSATLTAKWKDYETKTINNTSKGFAGIVSNPRTISPYLNEGSGSNQLMIYGNGQNVSVLTYELSGLVPNSNVVVSVDVYNLMSSANLEKALQAMNEGVTDPDDLVTEIKLGRKLSFTMESDNSGLTPGSGEFSAPAPQLSVSTSMQTGMMPAGGTRKTTNRLDWGEKQTLTLTAKADNTGNVTFYFTGTNADFGPLALDNLRVEGEVEPTIRIVGNPCPKMSAVLKLNSEYPNGTKYSWKETSTGETSSDQSMIFFPLNPGDYTVSCTVTTPDGCESSSSHKFTVEECCDDGNGNPMALTDIYLDDFGRFSGSTYIYRDKKGQEQTTKATEILVGTGNHGYSIDDQLNRGAAFAKELKFSGRNFRNGAYAIATENAYNSPSTMFDASGEKGGAFLQIDMKGDGWLDKVVYEQEITDLCPERLISFSAAVGAINKAPSAGATNATIQVRLVNSETDEVIMADGLPIEDTYVLDKVGWVEPRKKYEFKLPNGVESVKIQIISKEDDYKAAQRGDIALDDIAFRVCTPPNVEVVASSRNEDLLNLCTGDELVLEAKIKAKEYFEKPRAGYLFQFTKKDLDDPSFNPIYDWEDLGDTQYEETYTISDPVTHKAFVGVDNKEKVRFRVVVGEYEYLKNQRALWETLDELSPCRNISFSTIPVEVALNCDMCEPVDKASIISADPSTLITTNGTQVKEVILCPGEVANLTTETFAPANSAAMGISAGSDNEPRKYVASWHKGTKSARGIAGAGSAPGDPVSFYNVMWEDSDWYYLLVKDIEFPDEDGKRCWRWDSIHVVAGNPPTETLEDPAVFCEGMLLTEPTKTISGFKIDWYDGADTIMANHISSPTVREVTRDLSPKSFWYVLNDENGCRGKVEKYTVSAQRVDNPTASTITYIKADVENGALLPTQQSPNAIVGDGSSSIVWYNDDETGPIDEADATPTAAEVVGLDGNLTKKYKIKQVNSLGCESTFVPVSIVVSGYPAPTVNDISVCENSPNLKDTLVATINGVSGGNNASEFKLVWYKCKEDGTIDDSQEFDRIELSPTIQKASATEKEKKYVYYVRQRLKSNPAAESAPVAITVTVNTNPKLTAVTTEPKCLGETQNLKEMYNVSIDDCEVKHYLNGSWTSASTDVTEAGDYLVQGSYVINAGEVNEETCLSDQENLTVVFHELNADITGDGETCPNTAVDLDLDLTLGGGLTEDKLIYSWSNNLNNTKTNTKTYNTGTAGLNKAGDEMTVAVEVSSAACKGDRAVKKEKKIKVGDSRLDGKIKFSETGNSQPLTENISSNNLTFKSCGGVVSVELSDVVNKDGGSYDLTGTEISSGNFSNETAGSASLSLGVGSYTISYINGCSTKFSFKIVDNSAKANSRCDDTIKCEKEEWWAEIVNLEGPSNTVIEWQHDGTRIDGLTGKKLNLRGLKSSDSGVYSYSLLSDGCRFDNVIANGDKLLVKPIAKFDKTSFKNKYEVINGESLSINVGFTEPSSQDEIADGVKWTGYTNPNGLSLTIPSVERVYNIHVTAENDLYCKADTDIVVDVDARLKMEAKLDKYVMCEGETHQLIIDTTGTGNVLHPGLVLTATETIGTGTPRVLTLKEDGDKLVANISPSADASYNVVYTYSVGSQDSSLRAPLNMKVYETVNVEISDADPVCGDGLETISIDVTPNAFVEELDWSDNPSGEVAGSMTGATITPVYNGTGVAPITKQYKVVAKNQYCEPKSFFIPVEVHKPLEGRIDAPSVICEFDKLHLDASSYHAETYEWLYEEKNDTLFGASPSLVAERDFANFTLYVTRGECKAENTIKVNVARTPVVTAVDSISYKTIQIQIDENESAGPYLYIIDGNDKSSNLTESLRSNVQYGAHTLRVVDQYGCKYDTTFIVNFPAIEIPIFITPEGNGQNDKFEVKGLAEGYPDAVVTIYDRWGKKLVKYRAGDDMDWDGVYNGNKMPSTDYWYEIDIDDIDKTYTGHFTLLR